MTDGMEIGYERLDKLFAEQQEAEMPNKLDITAERPRDRHHARLRRPAQSGMGCSHQAGAGPPLAVGPPGWAMPVCEIEVRTGGPYRYEWEDKGRGMKMGMGGVFTGEVNQPEKLGAREKFDDDWTSGETDVSQVFTEKSGRTTLVLTVIYASKEARDGAAATGMTDGMEQGYARLDAMLRDLG